MADDVRTRGALRDLIQVGAVRFRDPEIPFPVGVLRVARGVKMNDTRWNVFLQSKLVGLFSDEDNA